jgi:hypothetical protein
LRATTHDGADASTQEWFYDAITHCGNDAGEFHTRNVDGPPRRGRVETVSLHEIRRVDARGMHGDQDVVRTGLGGVALFDL